MPIFVYLAGKLRHTNFLSTIAKNPPPGIEICSNWHEVANVEAEDANAGEAAASSWRQIREEIRTADVIIAYGLKDDPLNGTLIETGMAVLRGIPIYLIGDYAWGSWRRLPNVTQMEDHYAAFYHILEHYS